MGDNKHENPENKREFLCVNTVTYRARLYIDIDLMCFDSFSLEFPFVETPTFVDVLFNLLPPISISLLTPSLLRLIVYGSNVSEGSNEQQGICQPSL